MTFLIILAIFSALLLWYAIQGREWLKTKPWAQDFFDLIEPVEIVLFKKSETILFGRLLTGLGAVLTFLTQLGEINLAPIIPFVPEKYQFIVTFAVNCLPLVISGLGAIVERLRNRTTKPIELVAVPETTAPPEVKAAMAEADAAKDAAVATVADAKAA